MAAGHTRYPKDSCVCVSETSQGGAGQTTKVENNCAHGGGWGHQSGAIAFPWFPKLMVKHGCTWS